MASDPELVLVNPGSHEAIYQSLAAEYTAREPPVWAGLIATYMRNGGFDVRIIDALAEGLTPSEAARRVEKLSPALVGIVVYGQNPSASTQVMPGASAFCSSMKEIAKDLKVIMIGGHVSALPERTIREEKTDFVADNEGTQTLLKLTKILKSGRGNFSAVPGLWYRENGEIRFTGPAPLMKDLDQDIPGVAWDLLPLEKYRAHNWHAFGSLDKRRPYASVYTTLGCTFRCTFCCINAPFDGPSYRLRSPENVIQEIDTLVNKHGVRHIKFADEMFVLNVKHVTDICDLLIERDYDLNIWAYARVDTVGREGVLPKLKKAGFNWLAFGIESGSDSVRKKVNKGFSQDLIYRSIQRTRAAGINIVGNYILGLPDDSYESMQATLDLALELNTEWSNFYSCMAYPGSGLYDLAVLEGWPLPESWSGYSQHSVDTLPLPTKHLSGGEVLWFRDRAFKVYFDSREYLEMIEKKFGAETADHVRQMSKIELRRKYAIPPSTHVVV